MAFAVGIVIFFIDKLYSLRYCYDRTCHRVVSNTHEVHSLDVCRNYFL